MAVAPTRLSDSFWIAPQIEPSDVAELAAQGVRAIVVLRPNEEAPAHPSSDDIAAEARKHGIATRYLPVPMSGPTEDHVQAFEAMLTELPAPVLGFCKSGMRAQGLWQVLNGNPSLVQSLLRHLRDVFQPKKVN